MRAIGLSLLSRDYRKTIILLLIFGKTAICAGATAAARLQGRLSQGGDMPVELKILALGAVLLFIYIFTATRFKTAQYGREWNVSARDGELPPPNPISGRTMRAQATFLETFHIAIVALLGVVI